MPARRPVSRAVAFIRTFWPSRHWVPATCLRLCSHQGKGGEQHRLCHEECHLRADICVTSAGKMEARDRQHPHTLHNGEMRTVRFDRHEASGSNRSRLSSPVSSLRKIRKRAFTDQFCQWIGRTLVRVAGCIAFMSLARAIHTLMARGPWAQAGNSTAIRRAFCPEVDVDRSA
jgi:hypothetical protein